MNFRFSAIALVSIISVIAQLIPCAIAIPAKAQEQSYIGSFNDRRVYLLPATIKLRGNLKRFQTHNIYKVQQTSLSQGYKYTQSLTYWVANCQEGSIGFQKSIHFDAQSNLTGEFVTSALKFKIPVPDEMQEKILDSACDYKK